MQIHNMHSLILIPLPVTSIPYLTSQNNKKKICPPNLKIKIAIKNLQCKKTALLIF